MAAHSAVLGVVHWSPDELVERCVAEWSGIIAQCEKER